MTQHTGIWFVRFDRDLCRHEPWRKRVMRLHDRTVLEFFQRLWRGAPGGTANSDWTAAELGVRCLGLEGLFAARDSSGVDAPKNDAELRDALLDHLAGECEARYDDGVLRVLGDAGDPEFAWLMFDDAALGRHRSELEFAVHTEPRLPTISADRDSGAFETPTELIRLEPSGAGEGRTFAMFLPAGHEYWLSDIPEQSVTRVIEGVRLPALADWLRSVVPQSSDSEGNRHRWPLTWLVLRGALRPADDIGAALRRLARFPGDLHAANPLHGPTPDGGPWTADHTTARTVFEAEMRRVRPRPEAEVADVDIGAHHAAVFLGGDCGPIVLFDDVWAASHPDMAASMLRFSLHWDPLDSLYPRKTPRCPDDEVSEWHFNWDCLPDGE